MHAGLVAPTLVALVKPCHTGRCREAAPDKPHSISALESQISLARARRPLPTAHRPVGLRECVPQRQSSSLVINISSGNLSKKVSE